MKVVDIRSNSSERLARAFLDRFCAAQFNKARVLTADGFRWFGRSLSPSHWRGKTIRSFGRSRYRELRVVPEGLRAELDSEILDGAPNAEAIYLFDLERKDRTVTAAIGGRAGRVQRIFDPSEIKRELRKLAC